MSPYLLITLAVLLPVVAFLVGGLISRAMTKFLTSHGSVVMAFAGGAMLALSLGHVLPESIEEGGMNMLWWVLGGIVLFYIIEHLLCRQACPAHDEHCHHHATEHHHAGHMTAIGLAVHSLFDGIIVVLAGLANPAAALLIGAGIALHRLPNGAILGSVLTIDKSKHLTQWVVIAGCAPLIGLLLLAAHELITPYLAIGAALSAGALFYVALAELLPRTHQNFRWMHLLWLLAGVGLIVGLTALGDPHGHGDEDEHDEIHETA